MAKKESAKRGYMTKEEIEGHLENQDYGSDEKDLRLIDSISYLNRILKKRSLLSEKTELYVYEELAELYDESAKLGFVARGRAAAFPIAESVLSDNKASKRKMARKMREKAENLRETEGKLEGSVSAVIIIAGIFAGIFFLSPIVTGNVIGNLTNSTTNYLGIGLLVCGLVGAYFWKKRK